MNVLHNKVMYCKVIKFFKDTITDTSMFPFTLRLHKCPVRYCV